MVFHFYVYPRVRLRNERRVMRKRRKEEKMIMSRKVFMAVAPPGATFG